MKPSAPSPEEQKVIDIVWEYFTREQPLTRKEYFTHKLEWPSRRTVLRQCENAGFEFSLEPMEYPHLIMGGASEEVALPLDVILERPEVRELLKHVPKVLRLGASRFIANPEYSEGLSSNFITHEDFERFWPEPHQCALVRTLFDMCQFGHGGGSSAGPEGFNYSCRLPSLRYESVRTLDDALSARRANTPALQQGQAPSGRHIHLLRAVYQHAVGQGEWPVALEFAVEHRAIGFIPDLVKSLRDPYFHADFGEWSHHRLVLTIWALEVIDPTGSIRSRFVSLIKALYKKWKDAPDENHVSLDIKDLSEALECPPLEVMSAALFIESEPDIFSGATFGHGISNWSISINRAISRYRSINTWDDYLSIRDKHHGRPRSLADPFIRPAMGVPVSSLAHAIHPGLAENIQVSPSHEPPIRILHLSDLHVGVGDDPISLLQPLAADLRDSVEGLNVKRLDYLVISGDITRRAGTAEFDRARDFVSQLIEQFDLTAERCIFAPGNHDLDWETEAYTWKKKRQVDKGDLKPHRFVEQGDGYLLRNEEKYPERFKNFSQHFYHPLTRKFYPLAFEEQCISSFFPDTGLQFVALNSAWEIDEYFKERSSICEQALTRGLAAADLELEQSRQRGEFPAGAKALRLAVCHHPITGNEKIHQDAFVGQLLKADVRLCLHGHVHEDRTDLVNHLHPVRRLHVVGAGSFGAPTHDRPESVPRLYNLMEVQRDLQQVRVHTRCRRKHGGAWEGWAIWPGERPGEKRTYYDVPLT